MLCRCGGEARSGRCEFCGEESTDCLCAVSAYSRALTFGLPWFEKGHCLFCGKPAEDHGQACEFSHQLAHR